MALLQSYPMEFTFFGSKSDQSKQVGNSVPVMLAFNLAKSISEFFKIIECQKNLEQKTLLLEKSMY